jgi:hypothetical protein
VWVKPTVGRAALRTTASRDRPGCRERLSRR